MVILDGQGLAKAHINTGRRIDDNYSIRFNRGNQA
jgi:hypothetical protein